MKKTIAKITLLCFGSELTDGNTLDTNSRHMARCLLKYGLSAGKIVKIPDEQSLMMQTLEEEFRHANLLLTTGGLGPTFDDLTIPVLAKFFNREFKFNRFAYESIAIYFKKRGKKMKKRHRMQAFLPKGCQVIENRVGVCPALYLADASRRVIAMPGVPSEMEGMFESSVIPFILKHYASKPMAECFIRTGGAPEVEIEKKVLPLVRKFEKQGVQFGIYPGRAEVSLKVKAEAKSPRAAKQKVRQVVAKILPRIAKYTYGLDNATLAQVVAERLARAGKTLALAESCTGGQLATMLTEIPGASKYFLGACVAYQNAVKENQLGVSRLVLRKSGAVSEDCARQMASGVREAFDADYGIAITGIAGPSGGTKTKPVGLVVIAIARSSGVITQSLQLYGNRQAVREKAAKSALFFLLQVLAGLNGSKRRLKPRIG